MTVFSLLPLPTNSYFVLFKNVHLSFSYIISRQSTSFYLIFWIIFLQHFNCGGIFVIQFIAKKHKLRKFSEILTIEKVHNQPEFWNQFQTILAQDERAKSLYSRWQIPHKKFQEKKIWKKSSNTKSIPDKINPRKNMILYFVQKYFFQCRRTGFLNRRNE